MSKVSTKHGRVWKREYRSYWGMRQRCYQLSSTAYHNYGARGIKVCDRWLESFKNFFADMGPCPSKKHSIERIDNDGNYEPSNCKWATIKQQSNNKRASRMITFNGRTLTITQWAHKRGFNPECIFYRLKHGWSVERALTVPSQQGGWAARKVRKKAHF